VGRRRRSGLNDVVAASLRTASTAASLLLALAGLAGCDESALSPPDAGARDAGPASGEPPPAAPGDGAVSRIVTAAEVPLAATRNDARDGDWMLRGGGVVAVVSADKGRLVDFAFENGDDGVYYLDTAAFDAFDRMHVEVARIEAVGNPPRLLHVVQRVLDKPLDLHVWYALDGGMLRIESLLASRGAPVLAVTLGETLAWGNTPTWVEGHGPITTAGSFGGAFVGRSSQGLSYAACSDGGRMMARFSAPELPGFHASARTGEVVVTVPAGGTSPRRTLRVAAARQGLGDAAMALPCVGAGRRRSMAIGAGVPAAATLEVARCLDGSPPPPAPPRPAAPGDNDDRRGPPPVAPSPQPLARFANADARTHVALPEGCWVARLTAPGHAPGRWRPVEDLGDGWAADGLLPAAGVLRWRVDVDGEPAPAKLLVRGVRPTPHPDWGDDAEGGAAIDAVYSESGRGERPLPPGKYEVFVQRGPEHTMERRSVEVRAGASVEVRASLQRVVETPGWISADLHVHAAPSSDAPVLLADRVRSLAAVDVQVAAATDHNRVTDYGPTIRGMGLERRLASIVGNEVTTRDVRLGHFNAFPLAAAAAPTPVDQLPPGPLFASIRASGKPGVPVIVQVNHPRMGDIGYLELLRMDERDVAGWQARAPLADLDFEALEVFNGDHYAEVPKVERAMRDWYALLEAGHHIVATGNSDTHKVTFQEAGVPRNWVAVPDDDPGAFDERAFADSVRAGRLIVSSGPFVTLVVAGQPIGGTVGAGTVPVEIEVQAPPWIDVAVVELLRRGRVVRAWRGPFAEGTRRLRERLELEVLAGDWLVVVVRGEREMAPLHRSGAKPFAFTNPVWVR
jgi:hypothetical protein